MTKPTALITGATSGIGEATARILAPTHRLIVCGRRKERLDTLAAELSSITEITSLTFDVRDKQAVDESFAKLSADWEQIDLLVNNAGNAHGLDHIQEGSVDDWDAMIDINVKGLLYVTKAVLPNMTKAKSGHVINIGSIAGKEVYEKGAVYCASKFAVDALTQGMRIDLNTENIRVTSINPGLVETEFSLVRFKGDEDRAKSVYAGFQPLTAEDIADAVRYVASAPAHVTVTDMTILATAQASATKVNRRS